MDVADRLINELLNESLNIYNAFRAKKGPGKWIRERFGQPPVLLSDVDLNKNVKVLQSYLQNIVGFNISSGRFILGRENIIGLTFIRQCKVNVTHHLFRTFR